MNFKDYVLENDIEEWAKEDLIALITENDFDIEDIYEISDLVLDILDYDEESDEYIENEEIDELSEKMSVKALQKAKKLRKKPAYKKAQRLRKKCLQKHGDKVKNSIWTCNVKGKVVKGKSKKEKRLIAKTRRKNKGRIIK